MSPTIAAMPAYNEERSIARVVLGSYADRVIVVDDGSHDRAAEVATLAGAEVIRHTVNMGKGAVLKTGFGTLNSLITIAMGPEPASKRNLL